MHSWTCYKPIGLCFKPIDIAHQSESTQSLFLFLLGETCSGKSSLVNLILGEELLPYSALCTTSTMCELKYGEERKIVAHFKEQDPKTGLQTKTIHLQEQPTGSTEQSYLQQISPYMHEKGDREMGPTFKKIELFWPHSLLQVKSYHVQPLNYVQLQ